MIDSTSNPEHTLRDDVQELKKNDGDILKGHMGVLELMFTVIAYNGPAVVFMGFIPVAILLGTGVGTPVTILAVGLIILLIASSLMRVSGLLKRPGGFYAFITAGLGREAGLAAGFGSIITYFAALLSVYALSGIALSDVVVGIFDGPKLPWPVGGVIVLAAVSILGHFNISFSAKALTWALAAEILLIAVYCVSVFIQGGADGIAFDSFAPANMLGGSVAVGALFAVGLFGGFESTVIFREEVKNPERTIPRATYAVVATIAIMYAATAWAFINAYGPSVVMDVVANAVDPSGTSVREYVGDFAYNIAILLLFTSAFALALASHNILSRYLFNLGADGVLPRKLGRSHPKHISPHRASIVVSGAALVVLIILIIAQTPGDGLYGYIAGIYSYGMLLMMTLVSLALAVYLIREVPGAAFHGIATLVAFIVMCAALVFASLNFELLSGMSGLLAAVVLALIWIFIGSGFIVANSLRKTKPAVYMKIGRQ